MRTLRTTIVGAALMALIGGAPPAVIAQEGPADPPSELTGRLSCTIWYGDGVERNVVLGPMGDGNLVRRETRGFVGHYDLDEMSDERLMGTHRQYIDTDEYVGPDPLMVDVLRLDSMLLRIENDDGAWQGSDASFYLPGTWEPVIEPRWEQTVLEGEGAYEGLTALIETRIVDPECYCWSFATWQTEICSWDVRGVIIEGEMPAAPVPSA